MFIVIKEHVRYVTHYINIIMIYLILPKCVCETFLYITFRSVSLSLFWLPLCPSLLSLL